MHPKRRSPDFMLMMIILLLLSIGVVMVFSSSCYYAMLPPINNPFHFLIKQLSWMAIGIFLMFTMMKYDYWQLKRWAGVLLGVAFVLLIAVLFVGISKLGAQRWFDLGPFSFQPSELAKLCLIIFTAYGLSRKRELVRNFAKGVLPFLMIAGLAGVLILLQPDLGTAFTLVSVIIVMLFIAGANVGALGVLCCLGGVLVAKVIASEEYRLVRFMAFLDPSKDPSGAGWHILNSLMSLGSGGLLGAGLGQGRHSKFLYLPERQTDFIFAVIGEELGFIGASLVIVLFLLFVWRGFKIAFSAPDPFAGLLAAGIVSSVAIQAVINIGVVTSVLPITGITLPFISFGGSSLVVTLAAMGILLNISRYCVPK